MRFLAATWDGGGNLPPMIALCVALQGAGHEVQILSHDVQHDAVERHGLVSLGYTSAPQWDFAVLGAVMSKFELFSQLSAADLRAETVRLKPDALLIDCMMPNALSEAVEGAIPVVSVVHACLTPFRHVFGGRLLAPMLAARLGIVTSWPQLDPEAGAPAHFHYVGPLRPESAPSAWSRWRADRPLVLASLSTAHQSEGQGALLQRLCDALADLPVDAVVTTGRGIDPADLRGASNISIARFVPHEEVLKAAALMISHAGHGSVTAALGQGVPLLCLPVIGDQPFNAERVTAIGAGETLDPGASTEVLRSAILRLLDSEDQRRSAQAFARSVSGPSGVERGIRLVEALARGIG